MSISEQLREAEDFFHARIPLTLAMGIHVVRQDQTGFAVEAPLAPNSNHLETAFGGSINAIATLAAYGLLWMGLRDQPTDVVIRESAIRFLRPIRGVIRATCAAPSIADREAFRTTLRTKNKARISLRVRVEGDDGLAAEFDGTFVASRTSEPEVKFAANQPEQSSL
jgi:thioesterase domain-containing protein